MIALLFGSGFTSAAEVAYFSLSPKQKVQLDEDKTGNSIRVIEAIKSPELLLATLLILNNLFNLGLVLLSSVVTSLVFNIEEYPIIAIGIQTFLITSLILVFGEVIPKTYATYNALSWTKSSSKFILKAIKLFTPFSKALVKSSKYIDGFNKSKSLTANELEEALDLTSDEATTPEQEKLLREIVKFGSTSVIQIMTPRQEIFAIN